MNKVKIININILKNRKNFKKGSNKRISLKGFQNLILLETIKRTYHLFQDNFIDFLEEIILKLNNYLEENLFEKIKVIFFNLLKFLPSVIIENSLPLLS